MAKGKSEAIVRQIQNVESKIQRVGTPEGDAEAAAKAEREAELERQEASMSALLANAADTLKRSRTAKAEQFEEQQTDFWKPEKAGDFVQGVFLGTLDTKYRTHCLGTVDKEDKPLVLRMNGTKGLTDKLKRVKAGTVVRITFEKSEKLGERTFKHFSVGVLK